MEVHAHTHTARKKWTHYLWEFLMLFLAVFCGFLAEYQLEHKIEKEKGKQYIQMLYEDLKTDTANFNYQIGLYKKKLAHLSGRYSCYENILKNKQDSGCLQELISYSVNFPDLVYADRTLQQLKNAGGLRLLPQEDADSILFYDNSLRRYKVTETTSMQETQTNIREVISLMVNYKARIELKQAGSLNTQTPYLYPSSELMLNRYFNLLETYIKYCNDNVSDLQILLQKSTGLIDYLKTNYHLK